MNRVFVPHPVVAHPAISHPALIHLGACLLLLAAAGPCFGGALQADVERILHDKLLSRARAGVYVLRLGDSPADSVPLLQMNYKQPFTPASNLKVVTTSAALQTLGPDFKFRTVLFRHGRDLVLVGDGDPTFGDSELLRRFGWSSTTVFKTWAAGLAQRKLTSFDRLVVDDSVFDQNFVHPHWPADQQHERYVAQVSGLNFNANCVDFYLKPRAAGEFVDYAMDPQTDYFDIRNQCVGGGENAVWASRQLGSNEIFLRGTEPRANEVPISVTVHDPAMFTGTALAETLRANGISIAGPVARDRTIRAQLSAAMAGGANLIAGADPSASATTSPAGTAVASQSSGDWVELAVHETSLASVIARANKDSMNLYAECLCKRLGFYTRGEGSWQAGTAAVGDFLRQLGISRDQFRLDDGCGLSKQDAVSPDVMASVLMHDYYGANSRFYLATLAVAGEDGTLADRFRDDLRGRVIGKSGFVNGVSCLSGFLRGRDDNTYVFSIMFNGIPLHSNSSAKQLQEKIVHAIDADAAESRPAQDAAAR
jgi:D-alanyl-D-alanine carboxypeptidase/D-alanyl-D-alanine-endopeptidase (penicillin-binding protein 4)